MGKERERERVCVCVCVLFRKIGVSIGQLEGVEERMKEQTSGGNRKEGSRMMCVRCQGMNTSL
jgi:hypothetical protein